MYLITRITTHLPTPEGWMAELAIQLAVWRRIGKVRRPRPAF